jgi:hypothetical protein
MGASIQQAKQMIEEALKKEGISYEVDEEEGFYSFEYGSTIVTIEAYKDEDFDIDMMSFRADLAYDFAMDAISRDAALDLLSFNWLVPLGHVSLDEEEAVVWLEYNIPVELVTQETLPRLIGLVASAADSIVEEITDLVGGQ